MTTTTKLAVIIISALAAFSGCEKFNLSGDCSDKINSVWPSGNSELTAVALTRVCGTTTSPGTLVFLTKFWPKPSSQFSTDELIASFKGESAVTGTWLDSRKIVLSSSSYVLAKKTNYEGVTIIVNAPDFD